MTPRDVWCAIHQPNLFPRLSTVAKLFTADLWVVLDDVQFTRRDYQHRCRLPAPGGEGGQWLSLPVHLPAGRATPITEVRLVDPAASQHRTERLLKHHFRRSPHWADLTEALGEVLDVFDRTDRLAEITETSTRAMLGLLGWQGTILRSSGLAARSGRSERLADLTSAAGATTYLCGTGGARYLDQAPFAARGLATELVRSPDPSAPQIWAGARTLTSLHSIAAVGPSVMRTHLNNHALAARSQSAVPALAS